MPYHANTSHPGELWRDHPEKSFAMWADWVDRYPKATKALLMAIQSAQIWCEPVTITFINAPFLKG
jgi:nitrate/nitrite transport system substrate-binding protein